MKKRSLTPRLVARRLTRDWRVKVAAQNLLGLMPVRVGFTLNEKLTSMVRGRIEERVRGDRLLSGLENLSLTREHTGCNFEDMTVLEFGTGWHGVDLILFHLIGARRVISLDQHQHLTLENMLSQLPAFERLDLASWEEPLGADRMDERFRDLAGNLKRAKDLSAALALLGAEVWERPACDPTDLDLPPASVDLFYSNSVLHRIPRRDLERGLRHIGERLLSERAVFFHRIDPQDINAMNHADPSLHSLKYLEYSDFFFDTFVSGRFNSQNRLRESDFIDLFGAANMAPVFVFGQTVPALARDLRVAKRFQGKSVEDLATTHSTIVGRRKRFRGESVDFEHRVERREPKSRRS